MGTDDLHHKRKAQRTKDINRQEAKHEPYDRVLIVCEDSDSSPAYLRAVCDELKLSMVNIEIHGSNEKSSKEKESKKSSKKKCKEADQEGSAPLSVVTKAFNLMDKDKGYDRVYCVIDRDKHNCFQEALQKAKNRKKIKMIISIPCFEYWLLLHFEFTTSPFQAGSGSHCDTVISALKPHLSNYGKGKLTEHYSLLKSKQEDAIKHATQRENECGDDPLEQRNPYTQLHHLVECLKHLKDKRNDEKKYREKCPDL
jgi:hypothetical protein